MKSSRNYPAMQLKVGTLVAVALGITLLALIFPTKGVNVFSPKIHYVAYFPTVAGLRASSPIWFSGVEVGTVSAVEFVPHSDPPRLKVELTVEKRIQAYIRQDSQAEIKGMGLLGDMYIDLSQGSVGSAVAADGQVLTGVPPKEFKQDLDTLMASAKGLLGNLEQITADIRGGKGALGQLVQDPSLYPEVKRMLAELQDFLHSLNQEEGTTHKLMTDPALYDELVATVREIRQVVAEIKTAGDKVLSPQTRETIDQTVQTASRVVKRYGDLQEKMDKIRFDLNFGLNKYEANVASGHADLLIWPNEQRYYRVGIRKSSALYGQETDQTTFDAQLAWRILETPLYIRGGLTRDDFFLAGLDLRLWEDDLQVLLDAYRIELDPIQLDLQAGVVLMDLIEINAGVEDMLRRPFYKAGITIHYRDDDLLTVLFKTLF